MAKTPRNNDTAANLGFEAKLWQMADGLRNNMDAAEYKHVVLGLIFLKYISDAFEAKHAELESQKAQGADPEDPDEYRAASIFWVPPEARWQYLKSMAPQATIGQLIDDAMSAIERDNQSLKAVLPKDYARPGLDKQRLGQIINLVSDIALGSAADRSKDTLGRVYEYFLARFASAEGKSGGQFYTPSRVVRVLVEMLAPYKGRVYDPCCGSGGSSPRPDPRTGRGTVGDVGGGVIGRCHILATIRSFRIVACPARSYRLPSLWSRQGAGRVRTRPARETSARSPPCRVKLRLDCMRQRIGYECGWSFDTGSAAGTDSDGDTPCCMGGVTGSVPGGCGVFDRRRPSLLRRFMSAMRGMRSTSASLPRTS